jgi:hypothetical protein
MARRPSLLIAKAQGETMSKVETVPSDEDLVVDQLTDDELDATVVGGYGGGGGTGKVQFQDFHFTKGCD